jgi:hypothetical protein
LDGDEVGYRDGHSGQIGIFHVNNELGLCLKRSGHQKEEKENDYRGESLMSDPPGNVNGMIHVMSGCVSHWNRPLDGDNLVMGTWFRESSSPAGLCA